MALHPRKDTLESPLGFSFIGGRKKKCAKVRKNKAVTQESMNSQLSKPVGTGITER